MKSITTFCTPAKIYLILAGFGFIVSLVNNVNVSRLIMPMIVIPLVTLLLNWLCSKGLEALSWVLILIPIMSVAILFMGMFNK
jgi:hypothetical protein